MSKKSLLPFERLTMSISFYKTKLNASRNQDVYEPLSSVKSFKTYTSASGAIPGQSEFKLPTTPEIKVP
jgi:hypothetical protein